MTEGTDPSPPEELFGNSLAWKLRGLLRRSSALRNSRTLRRVVVSRRHRELDPEDLFVASFPRSGNTWVRFVLADLLSGGPVDFIEVEKVAPNVGAHPQAPRVAGEGRLVKTHEAYRPEYRRAIYLVRDARDVLASWYRVTRTDPDNLGDVDEFVAEFVTHKASPYGAWHEHVRSWLRASEELETVQVIRFEDLRADPLAVFTEITRIAGIDVTPEQIEGALERNTADRLREREQQNLEFLEKAFGFQASGSRSGESGQWNAVLTEHHLEILRPALELNAELGYESARPVSVAAR